MLVGGPPQMHRSEGQIQMPPTNRWDWNNSLLPRVDSTEACSQPTANATTYTCAPAILSELPLVSPSVRLGNWVHQPRRVVSVIRWPFQEAA